MDPRLTEIVDSVVSDLSSGASLINISVLSNLVSLGDGDLDAVPAEDWEEFCFALHRAKPTMAPLFNVANAILLGLSRGEKGSSLRPFLAAMLEKEKRTAAHIIELADKEIEGDWFMTCSSSGTVRHVLLALAQDRALRVTVAESLPGGEGRAFAQHLAEEGVEAEVVLDSTVIARMAVVDAVIIGADSITPHGLVNKVGTRALAEAAVVKEIPAYAVCGWSKLSPVVLSEPVVKARSLGPRLTEHIQMFESTPLDLLSHLITDRGVLSPADLRMELRMEKVAPDWYDRGEFKKP